MKIVGELGSYAKPLVVVARIPDNSGIGNQALTVFRAIAPFHPIIWLNIKDITTPRKINYYLKRKHHIVFCETPFYAKKMMRMFKNFQANEQNVSMFYVWDSTEIPREHAEILRNFSLVLTCSKSLSEVLKSENINAEYVPLGLDVRGHNTISINRSNLTPEHWKFLSIGMLHPRKNQEQIVRVAVQLLESGYVFSLRLHSSAEIPGYVEKLRSLIPAKYSHLIHITFGMLGERELMEVYKSHDCYISTSTGETFNVPLREAISSGMPAIISDIKGHDDLAGLYGIDSIPANIPVPAFYPEVNGIYSGLQFRVKDEDVFHAMQKILRRTEGFEGQKISQNGSRWDFRFLGTSYRDLLLRNLNTEDDEQPDVVFVGHDGGFFSLFNSFVATRNTWQNTGSFGRFIPDWSRNAIKDFWSLKEMKSFCYSENIEENIFFKLFDVDNLTEAESDGVIVSSKARRSHSFDSFANPYMTYNNPEILYRSAGFQNWRNDFHQSIQDLHLKQHLQSRVDKVFEDIPEGAIVISVHIRHPSHVIEQFDFKMAALEDYFLVCDDLIKKIPNQWVIYIASDQHSTVGAFYERYGSKVLSLNDVTRLTPTDDLEFKRLNREEQNREGHQLQHKMAGDPSKWSISLAEDILVEAYCLARGDYLLHAVSNVSTAVLYLNPKVVNFHVKEGDTLDSIQARERLYTSTSLI